MPDAQQRGEADPSQSLRDLFPAAFTCNLDRLPFKTLLRRQPWALLWVGRPCHWRGGRQIMD